MKKKTFFATTRSNMGDIKYLLKQFSKTKEGKKYIVVQIILAVLDAVIPIAYIIIPGLIINELTTALSLGEDYKPQTLIIYSF